MSVSSNTNPALAPGNTQVPILTDISLRSGGLLSALEASDLARVTKTTMVTLIGPPDAGKSTLLATIHECFRSQGFKSLTFAGSQTLVAFERLCHLSRIVSGLDIADTERTKFTEDELYYHLKVCRTGEVNLFRTLFVMDVAGEAFDGLRMSYENCRSISSLKRTRFLTLLIDGEKLLLAKTRYAAIEDSINFLKCVWDSDAVKPDCGLQVVVTKVDELQGETSEATLAELKGIVSRRLDFRFPECAFHEVAARPKGMGNIQMAHGVELLLESWLIGADSEPSGQFSPKSVQGERESEAFLSRHFATRVQ